MFGTSGIRGEVGSEITAELAQAVGLALASEGYERVAVGRDARTSGHLLADAVSTGLRAGGADVLRVGIAATPTVARSVSAFDADAGVAVTASHNPPKDNGLKLWSPSGQAFDGPRREAIARRVRTGDYARGDWRALGDETRRSDAVDRHREALVESVADAGALVDLSVVVDAANGPGALTAAALDELGCDVTTLNGQPDGRFPGRPSEPTAGNCRALRRTVPALDADLGIAHDGDADRTMAVDGTGEFVPGDRLLALFGRDAAGPGDRIAAPLNTSLAVDDALAEVGAEVTRTRVGDVHVAEAARNPRVAFGGEPSGAWIWPDETLCPDGPLAACRLAELVARDGPLSESIASIGGYPMERRSVEVDDKRAVMERVSARAVDEHDDVEETDGVRVETESGWFLVRASGTQPLIRLTAEARDERRTNELLERATEYVASGARSGAGETNPRP